MLKYLLAPYSVEKFLTQDWTRKAVHIPASDRQKFDHLFSWQTLNHLLNFHQLNEPQLRFSLDGRSFSEANRRNWRDYLQQGATLVINGIDDRVPELANLARELCHEIRHPVQVNLYCSPAMQRGFDCHYDTHDVLILQIDGEKEWFIFPEIVSFPISELRSPTDLPPDVPPYLKCTLQQGDVLYIPRGHWHYAISGDHPSLHLTVGIDCFTGLHWLNWLSLELQNQEIWRQNLPLSIDGNSQALAQHLEHLRQHLIQYLQQPDLMPKYLDDSYNETQPITPLSLPTQLGFNIFDNDLETEFVLPQVQRIEVAVFDEDQYQVTVGSKQISLKGLPLNLVEKLFQQTSFSILEMADWAPDLDLEEDVVPLLVRLVKEGILFVKNGSANPVGK